MTAPDGSGAGGTRFGRLTRRSDFLRTSRGRSWRMPSLVLQARKGCGEGGVLARFGITVTKRLGTAVRRNRARRRLREAMRQLTPDHARPGYDYVIIARQGTLTQSFSDIVKELQTALRKVHDGDADAPSHESQD